jgi:hypothetical protein
MRRALLILLSLSLWTMPVGAQKKEKDASGPSIDKPAPDIVGKDLDGKPLKLSDYRGKVVLLDFWGNW